MVRLERSRLELEAREPRTRLQLARGMLSGRWNR